MKVGSRYGTHIRNTAKGTPDGRRNTNKTATMITTALIAAPNVIDDSPKSVLKTPNNIRSDAARVRRTTNTIWPRISSTLSDRIEARRGRTGVGEARPCRGSVLAVLVT